MNSCEPCSCLSLNISEMEFRYLMLNVLCKMLTAIENGGGGVIAVPITTQTIVLKGATGDSWTKPANCQYLKYIVLQSAAEGNVVFNDGSAKNVGFPGYVGEFAVRSNTQASLNQNTLTITTSNNAVVVVDWSTT